MESSAPELKVIDVHKSLGGKRVLAGIHLDAYPADTIAISGRNGVGKSTLLRVSCGLLDPSRGDVELGGYSLRRQARKAKSLLAYVPDGLEALPDLLASEFVAMVRALKPSRSGQPAALDEHWMQRLEIAPFWDRRLGALSFGQRKRVALLAALCGTPRLLLLDEPTNGLDPQGIELVKALIRERELARQITILSTNDAAFERTLSGRHYRLHEGKLVEVLDGGSSADSA